MYINRPEELCGLSGLTNAINITNRRHKTGS